MIWRIKNMNKPEEKKEKKVEEEKEGEEEEKKEKVKTSWSPSISLVIDFILLVAAIWGWLVWGENFLVLLTTLIIAVLLLVIAAANGEGVRWGLAIVIGEMLFASGGIVIANRIATEIQTIRLQTPTGSPVWALFFMFWTLVAGFTLGGLFKEDRNKGWIFAFTVAPLTLLYAVLSKNWVLWLYATTVGEIVMFFAYSLTKTILRIESWSYTKSILLGLTFSSTIGATVFVALTLPTIVTIVLQKNSWWSSMSILSGIICGGWMMLAVWGEFRKKKVRRR